MERRVFADGAEQRAFRKGLEQMLRGGEADNALSCVREKLTAFAGAVLPLIDLALAADPRDVALKGWDKLADCVAAEERGGQTITAISIDFSWPGHIDLKPDANGHLAPYIETNYYADLTDIAFSTASREEILAGYSAYGSEWQGAFAEIDNAIEVEGMSALYGAVTAASRPGDSNDAAGDAYLLAACTSAIVLHLAVRRTIQAKGLPKPMAVLVGSNEDFPFFDAPVVSGDEAVPFVRPAERPRSSDRSRDGYSQERAERERFDKPRGAAEFPELAEIAQVAERQFSQVRKPKDILPALGTVGVFALTRFLGRRK